MNFRPNELYIGVSEFFIIILPGAIFSSLLLPLNRHTLFFGQPIEEFMINSNYSNVFWFAFLIFSYISGYFISSLVSGLDPISDWVRKWIYPASPISKKQQEARPAGLCTKILHFIFEVEWGVKYTDVHMDVKLLRKNSKKYQGRLNESNNAVINNFQ